MIKLNQLSVILIVILNISLINGLFEDQIGKFDWRQKFVGKIRFGYFDAVSADKVIVATENNVLAALSSKNGDILWRRVLESENRGDIKFLHVNQNTKYVASQTASNGNPFEVITVTGHNPALVRGWDLNNGNLAWEWSLVPTNPENSVNSLWFFKDTNMYHVLPVWNSHIELTEYHANTGHQTKSTTTKITAGWIAADKCVLTMNYFACTSKDQLLVLDLLAIKSSVQTKTLDSADGKIKNINGQGGFVQVGRQVISMADLSVVLEDISNADLYMDTNVIQVAQGKKSIKITAINPTSGNMELSDISDLPETLENGLKLVHLKCKGRREGSSNQLPCRLLLSSSDGAIVLLQQNKVKWIREEALTSIVSVEFLDLTLSDAQGTIEEELNNKDADIWSSLTRRLYSQFAMVKNIVLTVFGLGAPPSASQKAGLVRDDFGLHKMMVILTESGKLFGIDNVSGKQHWIKILKDFTGFSNDISMKLMVQRTSKYYPLPAQCAIIARDKTTGEGLLYQFNPISGSPVSGGISKLGYKIQQASLLHENGDNFLRGILLVDEKKEIHVQPETSLKQVDNFFFYLACKKTGSLTGYNIMYNANKNMATTIPIWTLNLGGSDNEQKITTIGSKSIIEKVHSQGRVLADRSVLYKYINPNLIAVVTEGLDNIHKYILNVYLIDVVSGSIVFSVTHRRAKGPVKMIHSENWLVYSFYNEKVRRHEITTMELYEGKTQTNSTVWSSLNSPPAPIVERQSYIISSGVAALQPTITEKGITNKHVLIGLSSGSITEMPWALLDPRRHSMISPEKQREEGIIPYIPELPIQHESIINYNQSVARINGIYTAPSGLESTCLVLVYGLDLFVTRVSPSKTFDLLKEDFDYFLISIVLIALTTASYVVKHLAAKKAIKQAWK